MADVSLIVGTILEDWAPEIADNITDRNDFFRHYKAMDKANPNRRQGYKIVEGGRQFNETIFGNVNSTFKGYNDRETIDTSVGNPIKEAQYLQKIVAGSINMSILEDAQNIPKYQIHDLAEVKKEEAEFSMEEVMGASALSDGTTDTKIPGGLQLIIGITAGTVGTIAEGSFANWAPQRDTTGVSSWNVSNEGLIALDAIFQKAKRGQEQPDLLVTTTDIASLINIMNITQLTLNQTSTRDRADLGFGESFYRKARVIVDDNVPTGYLYGVNTRHLRFKVLRKGEFKMTKSKQPVGGLYNVKQLYVFCNFTCSSRRLQFVMTGITG